MAPGAYHLKGHDSLPPDEAYVQCVEKHDILGEGSFQLVICMFKSMMSRTGFPI